MRWETQLKRINIARYDVQLRDTTIENEKESLKIYKTHSNQEVRLLSITDLKVATRYGYRVRSVYRQNGGRGEWSSMQYFVTKSPGIYFLIYLFCLFFILICIIRYQYFNSEI